MSNKELRKELCRLQSKAYKLQSDISDLVRKLDTESKEEDDKSE